MKDWGLGFAHGDAQRREGLYLCPQVALKGCDNGVCDGNDNVACLDERFASIDVIWIIVVSD